MTRNLAPTLTLVGVLISQWQAPIPWLHCHSEPASLLAAEHLDRHTAAFHGEREDHHPHWHLHFAMLGDILRGCGCPSPPSESDDEDQAPAAVAPLTSLADDAWQAASRVEDGPPRVVSEDMVVVAPGSCWERVGRRRQFLGDHAASGRLQAVLCIAQC